MDDVPVRRRTGERRCALVRDPIDSGRFLATSIVDTRPGTAGSNLGQ